MVFSVREIGKQLIDKLYTFIFYKCLFCVEHVFYQYVFKRKFTLYVEIICAWIPVSGLKNVNCQGWI